MAGQSQETQQHQPEQTSQSEQTTEPKLTDTEGNPVSDPVSFAIAQREKAERLAEKVAKLESAQAELDRIRQQKEQEKEKADREQGNWQKIVERLESRVEQNEKEKQEILKRAQDRIYQSELDSIVNETGIEDPDLRDLVKMKIQVESQQAFDSETLTLTNRESLRTMAAGLAQKLTGKGNGKFLIQPPSGDVETDRGKPKNMLDVIHRVKKKHGY